MLKLIRVQYQLFKAFFYLDREIKNFHILIGPNASGKSTFLEGIELIGKFSQNPINDVIEEVAEGDFLSLIHNRAYDSLALAFEFELGEEHIKYLQKATKKSWNKPKGGDAVAPDIARYEIKFKLDNKKNEIALDHESLLLGISSRVHPAQRAKLVELFPSSPEILPEIIVGGKQRAGWYRVLSRKGENVYFVSETTRWNMPYKVVGLNLGLSSIPQDPLRFPVATAVRDFFTSGLIKIQLDSNKLKKPSPPGFSKEFRPDGSNLAYVLKKIEAEHPERFRWWLTQIKSLLPEIETIQTRERAFDKHLYLVAKYKNGTEVPSWSLSDGTLRILALTLIAYLPDPKMYLIEEPENGLHPKAIEGVYEVLKNSHSQILMATHSPVLLKLAELSDIFVFAKTNDGKADMIAGPDHPYLRKLQGHIELDLLFASGVLS